MPKSNQMRLTPGIKRGLATVYARNNGGVSSRIVLPGGTVISPRPLRYSTLKKMKELGLIDKALFFFGPGQREKPSLTSFGMRKLKQFIDPETIIAYCVAANL